MSEMPNCPNLIGCLCFEPEYAGACLCSPTEKALRFWHRQPQTAPMSPEQRLWCLAELQSIEGWCDRLDLYVKAPDGVLADAVLHAWQDYCRDKGLM